MNIRIKRSSFTALAVLFLCAGFASMHTVSADERRAPSTVEKRAVGAFDAIELSGPFRVVVTEGAPRLELSGQPKQLADIETEVRSGTLVVRQRSHSSFGFHWGKRDEVQVVVRINATALKSLANSGSGDVELDGIKGERFVLASSGPGDIRARGTARAFEVSSSGSGDLDLREVKAGNVALTMSGPGDVRLGAVGNELAARLSGSGDLEATELRLARALARISGPGNATLRGSADELRADLNGSGELEAESLTVRKATIDSKGPGDVTLARVTDTLDASLHGSGGLRASIDGKRVLLKMRGPGSVELDGRAERISAELSGSGTLQARRLTVRQSDIDVHGPGNASVNQVRDGGGGEELVQVGRGGRRRAE